MSSQSSSRQLSAEEALLLLFVPLFQLRGRPLRLLDLFVVLQRGFEAEAFPQDIRDALQEVVGNSSAIFNLIYPRELDKGLCGKGYMSPEGSGYTLTHHGVDAAEGLRVQAGYTYEETVEWVAGLLTHR